MYHNKAFESLKAISWVKSPYDLNNFFRSNISYGFIGKKSYDYSFMKRVKQVHGTKIVECLDNNSDLTSCEADGLYTKQSGITLAIKTADCLPILFQVNNSNLIMAVHAGWRGLSSGIINTVAKKYLVLVLI